MTDNIHPIETEAHYDWALEEIARYFENEPNTGAPDGERLKALLDLAGGYEHTHWPI